MKVMGKYIYSPLVYEPPKSKEKSFGHSIPWLLDTRSSWTEGGGGKLKPNAVLSSGSQQKTELTRCIKDNSHHLEPDEGSGAEWHFTHQR